MRKIATTRYRRELNSQLVSLLGHGEVTVHQMRDRPQEDLPDPNDRATQEEESAG